MLLPRCFQVVSVDFAELFQLDQEHLEGLVGQVLGKVASARQPHRLTRLEAVLFGFAVGKCEA